MMPTFHPGDKVIVSSIFYLFSRPKRGDVIVFKYQNKFMIKRVSTVNGEWYMVNGDNKKDSLEFPKLRRKDILGKVITKI